MKYLARFIMWLGGWRFRGKLPEEKKAVIISVPHTSNWDFIWGELAFLSQGIPAYILMKKEFFFFPLGMIAGDSRRPWQERQSFGGADGDRVQKTGFHVFVHYTGGKS